MDTTIQYLELNWEQENLKEAWTRFKSHTSLMSDGLLSRRKSENQIYKSAHLAW
jgi:hypothetical protein